jgi:hypothetical protein
VRGVGLSIFARIRAVFPAPVFRVSFPGGLFFQGTISPMTASNLDQDRDEIFRLTQKLLMAATSGDWETYSKLCDPSLTAFEPEASGNLVDGLAFHHYYFKLPNDDKSPIQSTIVAPHIRMMGDVAIIAFVRLTQKLDANRRPLTVAMEETRVWQRTASGWKHVHFHRSPTGR